MSYEKEQQHLQKLLQEFLSDEEDNTSLYGNTYLSDEYSPITNESDNSYQFLDIKIGR